MQDAIESFWSMLKRGYIGTYYKLSVKHLHRYVNEVAGRHNICGFDTAIQMAVISQRMAGRQLRYKDLIKANGLYSGARVMSA